MKFPDLIKNHQLYVGLGTGGALVAGASLLIPGVLPIAVGALGVVGCAAGFLGSSFDFKRKPKQKVEVEKEVASTVSMIDSLPINLKAEIKKLQRIAYLHGNAKTRLFPTIINILRDSGELFSRIETRVGSQAHRLASLNYTDTLMKLNRALDSDYYLDILANARLWNDPEERLAAVEKAVEATEKQLVRNIRQVNASQDIDYEVSLESLTSSMDSLTPVGMTQIS